jgi:hypothetical protein
MASRRSYQRAGHVSDVTRLLRNLDEVRKSLLNEVQQVQVLDPKDRRLKRSYKQSLTFYFISESPLNVAHVGQLSPHGDREAEAIYQSLMDSNG